MEQAYPLDTILTEQGASGWNEPIMFLLVAGQKSSAAMG
jgi:hypothetical protein